MTTTHNYTCAAWGGGGVLGVAHVGAVRALDEAGVLAKLQHFAGTSAGAIVAGALACRATPKYLETTLRAMDFNSFLDDSWGVLRDAYRLYTRHGWYKGSAFKEWYGKMVLDLTGSSETTLGEAHERFGTTLVLMCWNNSTRQALEISYKNYPNMAIKTAVRMSMSVPILFQSCWLTIDDRRCEIQDGGIANNVPINVFDTAEYCALENFKSYDNGSLVLDPTTNELKLVESPKVNWETICFRLQNDDDTEFTEHLWSDTSGFKNSCTALVESMLMLVQQKSMTPEDAVRTVGINCGQVKPFDFSIDDAAKDALIEAGYIAAKNRLAGVQVRGAA
jgi:NTE family protein